MLVELIIKLFPFWVVVIFNPDGISIFRLSLSTSIQSKFIINESSSSNTIFSIPIKDGASFIGLIVIDIIPGVNDVNPSSSVTIKLIWSEPEKLLLGV